MKKLIHIVGTALPVAMVFVLAASGCSTMKGGKSGEDVAAASSGPAVIQVKAEPTTVDLDANLKAKQPSFVYADVKDFTSTIQDVRLKFIHVPLEVKMTLLSGTTWEARLTQDQLKKLAVSGETMRYQAEVVARNAKGQIATSKVPVDIAVKAPEASQMTS